MEILAEISDKTVGLGNDSPQLGTQYELRKSARAILLDVTNVMATQHLTTHSFHKLPGGGIEIGESIESALKREVQEEVGCACEILRPIGVVIEYRDKYRLLHISYCFEARVVGRVGAPALEDAEIEEGQQTLWLQPDVALEKIDLFSNTHLTVH
jgi:8-oxo-dGTP diphosphatase